MNQYSGYPKGPIKQFQKIRRMMNSALHCHPEPFAAAQCKLREGSVSLGVEMLRGVYTERSECAQHDTAVTHTDAWINVFMCIIGLRWVFCYPSSCIQPFP